MKEFTPVKTKALQLYKKTNNFFEENSSRNFSEKDSIVDEASRTDALLRITKDSDSRIYHRVTDDLAALQKVQKTIDHLLQRNSSPVLQIEEQAKDKLYKLVGKTYTPPDLAAVVDEQLTIIRSLRGSLSEAKRHSGEVLHGLRYYHDNVVLSGLENAVKNVSTIKTRLGVINNRYVATKSILDSLNVRSPHFKKVYTQTMTHERDLRKLRVDYTRSMQRIVFRDNQRQSLHEYDVMANTVLGMLESLDDMVDASLENATHLRQVHIMFREGAETIGALYKSFGTLKQTMVLQATEIGGYFKKILHSVTQTRKGQNVTGNFGRQISGYVDDVAHFARQTNNQLEDEANRIMERYGR